MKKKKWIPSACFLLAFIVWTTVVSFVDVQPIGPEQSKVGLAALNGVFHQLTGVHMTLYVITDWLGFVPIFLIAGFGILGLVQWIKRRNLLKVDRSILALGMFYIVVMAAYLFFEEVVVNYRPVLIEGYLEPSYPSSTTLLVLCVMPTAAMQFNQRIRNKLYKKAVSSAIVGFELFMVIGRLISGVHWVSDIIGGMLLSAWLVLLYRCIAGERKLESNSI